MGKAPKATVSTMNVAGIPNIGSNISRQIDSITNSNLRNVSTSDTATSSNINTTGMPNNTGFTGSISQAIDNETRQNLSNINPNSNIREQVDNPAVKPAQVLTEKDVTADCLRSEILLLQSYNSACIESVNQNVFSSIKNILNEEHDIHYEIFNTMKQKGWYPVSQANPQDINNTRNMFQG